MVFTLRPFGHTRAHLRRFATLAGLGTIIRNSGIVRFVYGGVVKTFRYVPQVIAAPMDYAGPIDLETLVDLDSLADRGASHWTFLAFPTHTVNDHGVPTDRDAQRLSLIHI